MSRLCAACNETLVVVVSASDDGEDDDAGIVDSGMGASQRTVPDDCLMRCGCHFHWQCLLDSYDTRCPACSSELSSPRPDGQLQVLCTLENEGGLQQDVDILPELTEEQYLRAFPNERKARAFLQFCREGNLEAVVELLQSTDESDDDNNEDQIKADPVDFLRYQDPMGDKFSTLHCAVAGGSQEVAWLLLLLASELDLQAFPPVVFQEAQVLGISRGDTAGQVDIRSLRDAQGRSAEDLATDIGSPWKGDWLGKQRLVV